MGHSFPPKQFKNLQNCERGKPPEPWFRWIPLASHHPCHEVHAELGDMTSPKSAQKTLLLFENSEMSGVLTKLKYYLE